MNQTIIRSAPASVQDLYQGIKKRASRSGKNDSLKGVVMAWIADPSYSTIHSQVLKRITSSSSHTLTDRWVSRKKLLSEMSSSEAEELIAAGAISMRPPAAPRSPSLLTLPLALRFSTFHHPLAPLWLQKGLLLHLEMALQLWEAQISSASAAIAWGLERTARMCTGKTTRVRVYIC
jgi:hypothetical protein